MRCRNDPTKWPLKEIPQQFLFKNNLNAQHPLFAHPMGPPSIVPLISPDLMVKNLPAPLPPPSIHIVSDPQAAMNLNPDVPEFIPRSGSIELKTEENCDKNDCEQTNKDFKEITATNCETIESSNKTNSQHSKYGKNIKVKCYLISLNLNSEQKKVKSSLINIFFFFFFIPFCDAYFSISLL